MAISTYDRLRDEARYCEERMRTASSRSEHEYYRERLRELERSYHMDPYRYGFDEPRSVRPQIPPMHPTLAPEPVTPLTFLKTADKKLLLTGATQ
jgi:hypothetical protein